MFKCDILIVPSREDAMWKSNPEADTLWLVFPITEQGGYVYHHFFSDEHPINWGHESSPCDTNMMRRIIRYARQPKRDLTVNTYFMSPAQAVINARYLVNKAEEARIASDAADLFMPLIDAAIAARDKREIATLFHNFPAMVEKSFILDTLRQAFPELRETGVTLDNWHKHGEGAES